MSPRSPGGRARAAHARRYVPPAPARRAARRPRPLPDIPPRPSPTTSSTAGPRAPTRPRPRRERPTSHAHHDDRERAQGTSTSTSTPRSDQKTPGTEPELEETTRRYVPPAPPPRRSSPSSPLGDRAATTSTRDAAAVRPRGARTYHRRLSRAAAVCLPRGRARRSSSPQPSKLRDGLAERDDDRDDVDHELGHGARPVISPALRPRAVAGALRARAAAVDLDRERGAFLDDVLELVPQPCASGSTSAAAPARSSARTPRQEAPNRATRAQHPPALPTRAPTAPTGPLSPLPGRERRPGLPVRPRDATASPTAIPLPWGRMKHDHRATVAPCSRNGERPPGRTLETEHHAA